MKMSKSEMATYFRVSLPTVSTWIRRGMPAEKPGKQWEIDFGDALEWVMEQKMQQQEEETRRQVQQEILKSSPEDWDSEYRKYKALRMQLEYYKERKELITIEESAAAFTKHLVRIRETLRNIPLSWQHRIVGIENTKDAQELLEELLDELLAVLSEQPDPEQEPAEAQEDIDDLDIADVSDIEEIND